MKELSFTQEYLLCALSPKGTLPALRQTEMITCLVAGGLLESSYFGTISVNEEKKIVILKELDHSQVHLEPFYAILTNREPLKIYDLAVKYVFSSHKLPDEFLHALCLSMTERQAISLEAGELFHNRPVYVPNQEAVRKTVEKIRVEFLEGGPIDDGTLVFGALLQKSGSIRNYFSKYESNTLNRRIGEIKKSKTGSLIKKMIDYIDMLVVVMASVSSSAGS